MNRHARAGSGMSPPTRRNATDGGQERPRRNHRRELPARHRERRPPARRRGPGRRDRHHRVAQAAARRVQRHRIHRQDARQPGEEPPHPPRRGTEPAQPVPHRVLRDPARRRDRPEPLAQRSPRQHVPDHRRPVAPPSQHPRREQHVRDPARAAPRPPRPHPHRDPPRREHPPQDRVAPPAQPTPAAGTRKQAVTQKLLRNRRAVAYREQRCLQAPHGPPRTSGKGNGEGRPETGTLTVSSHATPPQPEPPRKTRSPAKTQPRQRRSR